jgi:hypothetical protein
VKPALVALAGTVTVAGTVTALLLLDRLTLVAALVFAELRDRVQVSAPDPVIDPWLQVIPLRVLEGVVVPVPLRLMASVGLDEELLVIDN